MRLAPVFAIVLAVPLAAQERRSAPGGEAAPAEAAHLVLPHIAADPARPFVGVWQGEFHGPFNDTAPMSLAVEFVNGVYSAYSAQGPAVRLHPHRTDSVFGDTVIQWTQPNSGGGTLVFRARRTNANTLSGTMRLIGVDAPPELANGPAPTFTLRRVRQ